MSKYEIHKLDKLNLCDPQLQRLYNDIDQLVRSKGYPPFWPMISIDLDVIRLQWSKERIYCSILIDEETNEATYLLIGKENPLELYSTSIQDVANSLRVYFPKEKY